MSTLELTPAKALKHFFGFNEFKGEQEQVVQSVLDGNDAFVIMPTGGGKSMCYQLPALMMEGTAIVVSPLIALMKNQVDAIRGHHEGDSIAHFLNSSLSKAEAAQVRGLGQPAPAGCHRRHSLNRGPTRQHADSASVHADSVAAHAVAPTGSA